MQLKITWLLKLVTALTSAQTGQVNYSNGWVCVDFACC